MPLTIVIKASPAMFSVDVSLMRMKLMPVQTLANDLIPVELLRLCIQKTVALLSGKQRCILGCTVPPGLPSRSELIPLKLKVYKALLNDCKVSVAEVLLYVDNDSELKLIAVT